MMTYQDIEQFGQNSNAYVLRIREESQVISAITQFARVQRELGDCS